MAAAARADPSSTGAGAADPASVAGSSDPAPAGRGDRRKTAVPRARSGPIATASSSQVDRTCPSFSYVLVDSRPVTTTGSPLRSEATALPASVRQQVTLRKSDPASDHRPVGPVPTPGRGRDPEAGHVHPRLGRPQPRVVHQIADQGHARLVHPVASSTRRRTARRR